MTYTTRATTAAGTSRDQTYPPRRRAVPSSGGGPRLVRRSVRSSRVPGVSEDVTCWGGEDRSLPRPPRRARLGSPRRRALHRPLRGLRGVERLRSEPPRRHRRPARPGPFGGDLLQVAPPAGSTLVVRAEAPRQEAQVLAPGPQLRAARVGKTSLEPAERPALVPPRTTPAAHAPRGSTSTAWTRQAASMLATLPPATNTESERAPPAHRQRHLGRLAPSPSWFR